MKAWTADELLATGADLKALQAEAEAIVGACRAHLGGHHPAAQGLALAELVAILVHGYAEEARAGVLAAHLEAVRSMAEMPE